MEKSPDAFRTISEVAELLGTPAHVLRFWESRFPQIRPVKRAGGRRYYRPSDVALLGGIKRLLHDDGLTIRGVQKILREQGVRHVAAYAGADALPPHGEADIEALLAAEFGPRAEDEADAGFVEVEVQTAQVISLEAALARTEARTETRTEARTEAVRGQLPLDLPPADEDVPEAPFIEAEEEPLPDPVQLRPAAQAVADSDADESDQPIETKAETAAEAAVESTLAMRLRRADPATVARQRAAIIGLRDRMVELRARLAKGVRRRAR